MYDGDALVYRTHPMPAVGLGGSAPTDLSSSDPSVLYLWGPTGPVMEFDLSGDSRALTFDPRGDCVATSNGRAVNPVFFDAYGKPIVAYSGDDRYRQQPLQYKGQSGYYADAYSGLYYCLHRYYDYRTGRWTQRDPIGLDGGINVYAYCGGNPVMGVDPSGLTTIFGFEFTSETVGNGLGTGLAATGEALSFGHYRNKYYASQPGYGASLGLAVVGREAAIQAATLGAGNFVNGVRTARAVQVAREAEAIEAARALAAARAVRAARLATNARNGNAFERAAIAAFGYARNTNLLNGRIPDIAVQGGLVEIKSGQYISYTAQLRGMIGTGQPLYLVVNTATKVSKTLQQAIRLSGGSILRFDSAAGRFLPFP